MNLDSMCYKIFHIPNYGESAQERSWLFNDLDSYLSNKIDRLNTDTVLISNEDQYFDFNEKYSLIKANRKFKWGELGIWASNLLAIKNFIETDKEYLMLMEDDIYVPDKDRFLELLVVYMDSLPEDWEVFSYFVHENQLTRFQNIYGNTDIVPAYQDWSMLCYVLNKKSAIKILDLCLINGFDMPIDWYIYRQPEVFKSYTLSPIAEMGCKLYDIVSTFQEREEWHTVPEKRNA
jgi:GR25 family glycosyltransferase involved in LPS biosynthesis